MSILAQVRVVIVMMEKRGQIRPVFVVATDRTLGRVGSKKEEGVKDGTQVWVVETMGSFHQCILRWKRQREEQVYERTCSVFLDRLSLKCLEYIQLDVR